VNFIVIHVTTEPTDPAGVFDGSIDEEDSQVADVRDCILCKDKVDVEMALAKAEKNGHDWAVYEILDKPTGKKTARRAIIFEKDGKTIRRFE
jgi:hypothetical protein